MMMTFVKVLISALVIAAVTTISKQFPTLGGWIAALPIISLLSALWLVFGHQSSEDVARFFTGVLRGLLPTAILLVVTVICLRRGTSFMGALGIAIVAWGASSYILIKVGL
ncbi:DUF3147 family protein [Alicyclobacillus acidoterrestris]|uniref:DUF3147 family protein n=2 Tax=Alicyclobacillus acidoterrestris TaxID=1450 RepID=T0CTZ0_ALIAG|nr:DUF3147 family protein [Alicyclobacillus acidoterrestris]EPZ41021.1 hypothetical protein N007_17500 [Alicyclobacillus acidoterrestris ATCC 49025]UNO47815.1 DUF3147 family protein [Alicyclobacillus acidoterrestris]GEO27181.1 hypothetical protein AAC03nite_29660 [Alicyclobacillus acidoterrestris]